MALYLLYESASGYSLFLAHGIDEIGQNTEAVRNSVTDLNRFGKVVKLAAYNPFQSALDALNQQNAVSEGQMTDELKNFLELSLPKVKKGRKSKFSLGLSESKIGSHIQEETNIPCQSNEFILELIRDVRLHFDQFIENLKHGDLEKAQLGLGHSYTRAKVKFNVNREDNMVIQAISSLDNTDKGINTHSMRFRESYSWHFPELVKIVNDNYIYAKLAKYIEDKSELSEDKLEDLVDIIGDEDKAKEVIEAAKASMVVGARLISHASSLTNLAKSPSSTLQILGAEKALFRALKTKGNTPKYGLIFHSSFIGRASAKNKGRMARYLANKCSLAARIDCFSESGSTCFGDKFREQVEERLDFYDKGIAPRKNIEVMKSAIAANQEMDVDKATEHSSKKSKKKKSKDYVDKKADGKENVVANGDDAKHKSGKKKRKLGPTENSKENGFNAENGTEKKEEKNQRC